MKSTLHNKTGRKNPVKCSFSATWRAISSLPDAHFPLILPGVHPIASFFILRRLKRLGYSNCNVTASDKGLVVHAHR
jgi:hypothetical protein